MAASAPAISSLSLDSVLLQLLEGDDLQGHRVRGLEHDLRRAAGVERLLPALGAQAPAIARLQALEAELGHGRAEVVAARLGEGEELPRHHGTDRVQAGILAAGVAAAVAVEAGQGFGRA